MKQGIMGIGLVFTLLLVVATIMALGTENTMKEELDKKVSSVVYQSLEEYMSTGGDLYTITQNNINLMTTSGDLRVVSIEVDNNYEFVQVELELEYKNFATTRIIQSRRSAVVERKVE